MDEDDKPSLDQAEGLGNGYEQKTVEVVTNEGDTLRAFTYFATDVNRRLVPYHWYKKHVLIGAREHRLRSDYVRQIEAVEAKKDPCQRRAERELALYRAR